MRRRCLRSSRLRLGRSSSARLSWVRLRTCTALLLLLLRLLRRHLRWRLFLLLVLLLLLLRLL